MNGEAEISSSNIQILLPNTREYDEYEVISIVIRLAQSCIHLLNKPGNIAHEHIIVDIDVIISRLVPKGINILAITCYLSDPKYSSP